MRFRMQTTLYLCMSMFV